MDLEVGAARDGTGRNHRIWVRRAFRSIDGHLKKGYRTSSVVCEFEGGFGDDDEVLRYSPRLSGGDHRHAEMVDAGQWLGERLFDFFGMIHCRMMRSGAGR